MLEVETAWTCCERWQFGKLTSLFSLHRSDWHQYYQIFDHQYLEVTQRNRKEHIILGPCFFILWIAKFPLLSENHQNQTSSFIRLLPSPPSRAKSNDVEMTPEGQTPGMQKGQRSFGHMSKPRSVSHQTTKNIYNTYVTYTYNIPSHVHEIQEGKKLVDQELTKHICTPEKELQGRSSRWDCRPLR